MTVVSVIKQFDFRLEARMPFRNSISQTLVFGQLLGLMPISGVTSDDVALKFKWKSFRCFVSIIFFIGSLLFLLSILLWMVTEKQYSLKNLIILLVYATNLITIILFFNLRNQWPSLIKLWERMEISFPSPEDGNYLTHQLNLRLLFVAVSSIGENHLKLMEINPI